MFEVLVATVVLKDNKVLLIEEKREDIKGLLNIPAGHLEIGENLLEGAIRETKEESGYEVRIIQLLETKYFIKGIKNCICFVFQAELTSDIKMDSELNANFYDIKDLLNNQYKFRDENLITSAISKINKGSSEAIKYLI